MKTIFTKTVVVFTSTLILNMDPNDKIEARRFKVRPW